MSLYKDASLVMIPSAYKDGKLYSIRPTDGSGDFTFSRGSNLAATRVDVNGLIEKGRENLLLQSNQFDTSANWVNTSSSETSGQSGYDGSSDAWLLTKTDASGRIHQNFTASGVMTYSVYLKANASNYALIQLNGSGADKYMYIDLTNGTKGSLGGGNIDENIVDVGNGWYRCSITANTNATRVRIYPANSTGDVSATSGSIYIQDAQVEQGLVATDYIETGATTAQAGILEDMPRLDYSGSCPSLLLEPQRTNLLINSDYINGLPDVSNVSVTTNATTSPEGVVNASKVVASAANTFHWLGAVSSASTGLYTASIFAKSAELEQLFIVIRANNGADRYGVKFQINNKNVIDTITFGSPTQTSSSIEDYGNGWVRFSVSIYNTSGNVISLFGPSLGGALSDINNSFLGDGTSGIYMFGAQLEQGSYPTSYIPTYGTSQTRSQDVASLTGASSIIGQTQGSFFVDFVWNGLSNNVADNVIMSLGAQNYGVNNIAISNYNGSLYARVTNGISVDANIFALILVAGTRYKCLVTYTDNEVKFYVNGVLEGTDTSVSIPAVSDVYLQNNHPNSKDINQSLVFPTALTDSECIALTTI